MPDNQIQSAFRAVVTDERSNEIATQRFLDAVYKGVKAKTILDIKERINQAGKFAIDTIISHDGNRDGYLTYTEFEAFMRDIGMGTKPDIIQ